ncbi:CAP domain-containing protein [Chryseomicrobium palamuruense]|uniref:CAP domain-containing protein n=1 Tax=Chryseomicrobium palamuruense TaxID=682973 RepID=A0ABV8UW55_9BACL
MRLIRWVPLFFILLLVSGCIMIPLGVELSPTEKVKIALPGTEEPVNLSTYEQQLLNLVNKEREAEGLQPLQYDSKVAKVAQLKAQDLLTNNYFEHESPTYGSPSEMLTQFDVSWTASGENIAAGQRSVEEVHEGWMNSPGHRENILQEIYTHVGFGFTEGGGDYGTYWVQLFTRY